jgi:SAM-dependent methyltransferase
MNKKMKKRRTKSSNRSFWDKEYQSSSHLAMSINPSSDLKTFVKWLLKEFGERYARTLDTVCDLGCGNGRNLLYLAHDCGMKGVGFDSSEQAIVEAKRLIDTDTVSCTQHDIRRPIPLADGSQSLVLDMMTSHFLNNEERAELIVEIHRILRDDGWLFFKTFLRDEDRHAERLLKDYPADEEGSYIHPHIGVAEHVFTEDEIRKLLDEHFIIHKICKSHKHVLRGRAAKRRSISVYAQKK